MKCLLMKIKLITPNTLTNDVVMNVLLHDRFDGALNISSNKIILKQSFTLENEKKSFMIKISLLSEKIDIIVMLYHYNKVDRKGLKILSN